MTEAFTLAAITAHLAQMRDAICQNDEDQEAFDQAAVAVTDSADFMGGDGALEDEFRESGKTLEAFMRQDMAERFEGLRLGWGGYFEAEAHERALSRAAERLSARLAENAEGET